MTASKNIDFERTTFPHRLSISSTAPTAQSPKMNPRAYPHSHVHAHSISSLNPAHRVSRRKSTSANNANKDAVMAAIAGQTFEPGSYSSKRAAKGFAGPKSAAGFPASMPDSSGFVTTGFEVKTGSAVADGPTLESLPESEKGNGKNRVRRASEGSQLGKGVSKRSTAGELRCETCGKGYKHSSCLTKHLWEHTPEWQYTSKLLISKHQQVQLLEAASVLMAINQEGSSAVESDSSSPAASGSSDHHDSEMSSVEMTPPPQLERRSASGVGYGQGKRYSANSSTYSQSYQSSVFSESVPANRPYMSHYRQWSTDGRPTTSGTSVSGSYKEDQEQADLAAAVGLLSCSFGTPKTNPVMLPADVPPVPPLPAQFLGQQADHLSGSTVTMSGPRHSYSYLRARKDTDVEMDEEDEAELQRSPGRNRSDDEEEGMFGKMEE